MRTLQRVASPITADDDGIAQNQTTAGAGALILNGAGVASGIAVLSPARRVRFTSAADLSARTFTVTGLDRNGAVITDTVTGVNNTTVATNKLFAAVTAVAVDGAVASNVRVGWSAESVSGWIFLGGYAQGWTTRVFFPTGGTVNYDIEATSANILRNGGISGDHPDDLQSLESALTGGYSSANTAPVSAIRLKVNSSNQPVTLRVLPGY